VVSSLIPQSGGLGVLADVDKVFGNGGEQRRKTATQIMNGNRKVVNTKGSEDNYDDGGFDTSDNNDISNRGNNAR
jgi:oligoendopeptidase F